VVDWANAEIARVDQPTEDLFNLASYGPEKCLKWSEYEFPPRPSTLTYAQQFALRALATPLESRESTFRFSDWASRSCFGEDLPDPMVSMGYQLDQFLDDCQDKDCALAFVREALPDLLPQCKELARPFLDEAA